MSDRHDPKLSTRPTSDRQAADADNGKADADVDPLAELARIVSGRATPTAGAPSRSRTVPAGGGAAKPAEPDVLGDLEAELLSDLQASFSSIKETFAAAPRPAAEPQAGAAPPAAEAARPAEPQPRAAPPAAEAPRPAEPQPRAAPPAAEAPRPAEPPAPPARQPTTPAAAVRPAQPPLATSQPPAAAQPQEPREPQAKAPSSAAEPAHPPHSRSAPEPALDAEHPAAVPPAAVPAPEEATSERRNQRPAPPQKPAAPQRPAAPQPPLGERAARPAEPERPVQPPPRAPDAAGRADIPDVQLRQTINTAQPPAGQAQASARPPHSRWEKPAEPDKASLASRFAPPRAPAPPASDYEATEDELFGEGTPFADEPFADEMEADAMEAGAPDDELPFGEFDMVPGYGDEDQLPPYADDDLQDMVKRRSGRGPLIFAIAVALVLVAGLSFIVFRPGQGTGSPPPIITADGSPTKIAPPETPQPESDQNKLIYDRVASGSPASDDTTLVTPTDKPVDEVPTADGGADDNPISRVIIPGGPGFDQPGAEPTPPEGTATADAGQPGEEFGPRKVRTVVVRPDGTIVSSEANTPGAGADAQPPTADATPAAPEPAPAVEPPPATPTPPADTNNDTVAIAGPNGGVDANGELQITPMPETPASPDVGEQAAAEPSTPAPAATPQPSPNRAPAVADNAPDAPIDITPAAPTPAPAPAPRPSPPAQTQTAALAPNGGMLVQVSSQRSEDAARATFRDLQSRYPNILGPYEVNIQRANLGDRGIFYRARVGPFSPSDAQHLCNDLKAAGGDCILSRR